MDREFKIRQIYLKDVSFQAPMGAASFSQQWSPDVQVDIKIETETLGDALYEVALRLSVLSRTGTNTHFMIEIVQCGAFTIRGYGDNDVRRILHTVCAEALYPFARETVDGLIVKGRFPALLLDQVDFSANYVTE